MTCNKTEYYKTIEELKKDFKNMNEKQNKTNTSLRIEDTLLDRIENTRGMLSRSAWIRVLCDEQLKIMEKNRKE
ncbi:hypothetical protein Mpsy_0652 [Methanolobus psychrophilus R15]|nr:hypothetical protein Mpsy_0652 [Methanolobus psychrophilus R15]